MLLMLRGTPLDQDRVPEAAPLTTHFVSAAKAVVAGMRSPAVETGSSLIWVGSVQGGWKAAGLLILDDGSLHARLGPVSASPWP
jgi:hypothetical protein